MKLLLLVIFALAVLGLSAAIGWFFSVAFGPWGMLISIPMSIVLGGYGAFIAYTFRRR